MSQPSHKSADDSKTNGDEELIAFLAPAQRPDELGRLGEYRVLEILGHGGMGVVFKAEDPGLKRLVALKAMLPALSADATSKERFLREAQSAAALKHDHIVTIFQVGEDRGAPFLAMEFLDGESLDDCLKRERRLPIRECVRIGSEVAAGLAAAHERGLIHRDIKPANIWLEGNQRRAKILDFGLARSLAEDVHLTQSGVVVGTPAYMSPEQACGKTLDPRSDLYSLGVVLYKMATGNVPFSAVDIIALLSALALHTPTEPRVLRGDVPQPLNDLIMQLLAKSPADRIGSARDLIDRLGIISAAESKGQLTRSVVTPRSGSTDKFATRVDSTDEPVPSEKTLPTSAKAPDAGVAERSVRRRRMVVGGLAFLAVALISASIAYFGQPPLSAVRIHNDDPNIVMVFDTTGPTITGVPQELVRIRPGAHRLFIKCRDIEFETDEFTSKAGETLDLKIEKAAGQLFVVNNNEIIGVADLAVPAQVNPIEKKDDKAPVDIKPVPGKREYAIHLDGKKDRIRIPKTNFKYYGETSLTIEATVVPYRRSFVPQMILSDQGGSSGLSLRITPQGKWSFGFVLPKGQITAVYPQDVELNRRVRLAAVFDRPRGRLRIFVDGKKGEDAVFDRAYKSGDWALIIGADPNNPGDRYVRHFHGDIEEMRISTTARYVSDFEPREFLESDRDTVVLYRFDEGSGRILNDHSGGNRHALIESGKWVKRQ